MPFSADHAHQRDGLVADRQLRPLQHPFGESRDLFLLNAEHLRIRFDLTQLGQPGEGRLTVGVGQRGVGVVDGFLRVSQLLMAIPNTPSIANQTV